MRDAIRRVLKEELTSTDKSEIKKIFQTEFEKVLKSNEFKEKVNDIVRIQVRNDKKTEKEIATITQKVLVKLYKTFWTRRSFWSNNLENL